VVTLYASTEGTRSHGSENGGVFTVTLCEAFRKANFQIHTLARILLVVRSRLGYESGQVQCAENRDTLKKDVYFQPPSS